MECRYAELYLNLRRTPLIGKIAIYEWKLMKCGLSSFSHVPIAVVIVADALFLKILQKLDAAFHHYRCSRDIEAGLGRSLEYFIRHPVGRCIADTLGFGYDRNKVLVGMFRYSSLIKERKKKKD